jgi:hypothetical protein
VGGEGVQQGGQGVHGGVHAGGQQGADDERSLLVGDVALVGRRPDIGTETTGRQLLAGALGVDPARQLADARRALADQVVVRAEGVEGVVAVGQEVLAPFSGEPDRAGEDPQGEGLGDLGDGVEAWLGQDAVDQFLRVGRPGVAQPAQCAGAEDLRQDGTGRVVQRRVGLQQQARGTPRLLVAEVGQSHSGGGLEGLPVGQRGVDLLVAGHGVDVVVAQVHDRPGVAQCGLQGQRVLQDLLGERVGVRGGQIGGRAGGGHRGFLRKGHRSRTRRWLLERDTHTNMQSPAARSASSSSASR